jgi:hypothetical protein
MAAASEPHYNPTARRGWLSLTGGAATGRKMAAPEGGSSVKMGWLVVR